MLLASERRFICPEVDNAGANMHARSACTWRTNNQPRCWLNAPGDDPPAKRLPGDDSSAERTAVSVTANIALNSFLLNPQLAIPKLHLRANTPFNAIPQRRLIFYADDLAFFSDCENELPRKEASMANAVVHYFVLQNEWKRFAAVRTCVLNESALQHDTALHDEHLQMLLQNRLVSQPKQMLLPKDKF
jgi:hypothetical protein